MQASLRLGRIFGIEMGVNWSLLVVFGLITWSLAATIFPQQIPGYSTGAYWTAGIAAAVLFYVSLLAHELGHALLARRLGARVEGITLWLFGGVTRLTGEAATASAKLRIAIVGPGISLLVAGVSILAAAGLARAGASPLVAGMFAWLAGINLLLALFNLIPAFPLDGGRVLRAVLWRVRQDRGSATRIAARLGRGFGYLLIAAGIVEFFVTGPLVGGLWLVFLGWFMLGAAEAEESRAILVRALGGLKVADVMSPDPVVGPDWISVDELINQYLLSHRFTTLPVRDFDGKLSGLVTLSQVKQVAPEARPRTRVREIAMPLQRVPTARSTETLVDVLDRFDQPGQRLLVMDDSRLVGIVSPRDIAHALQVANLTGGRLPKGLEARV